jgi:hypothetical protein
VVLLVALETEDEVGLAHLVLHVSFVVERRHILEDLSAIAISRRGVNDTIILQLISTEANIRPRFACLRGGICSVPMRGRHHPTLVLAINPCALLLPPFVLLTISGGCLTRKLLSCRR